MSIKSESKSGPEVELELELELELGLELELVRVGVRGKVGVGLGVGGRGRGRVPVRVKAGVRVNVRVRLTKIGARGPHFGSGNLPEACPETVPGATGIRGAPGGVPERANLMPVHKTSERPQRSDSYGARGWGLCRRRGIRDSAKNWELDNKRRQKRKISSRSSDLYP